jgi:hypothetical protein
MGFVADRFEYLAAFFNRHVNLGGGIQNRLAVLSRENIRAVVRGTQRLIRAYLKRIACLLY